MKRIASLLLCLIMLLSASAALAENMGVQIIGGPATETEPVSLDDMKIGAEAEIEGWGILTLSAYEVQDGLGYYQAGSHSIGAISSSKNYYFSGQEADFVILYADILNTQLKDKNYLESISVKAVYDDVYEYAGWSYQRNYNNSSFSSAQYEVDENRQNTRWVISRSDEFSISPMYQGHYIYGCTLPKSIIEGKKPLKLIITIDGNEITYNIRK